MPQAPDIPEIVTARPPADQLEFDQLIDGALGGIITIHKQCLKVDRTGTEESFNCVVDIVNLHQQTISRIWT